MKLCQRFKRVGQEQPTSQEKYEQKRKMTRHGFPREWLSPGAVRVTFAWMAYNEEEG